MIRSELITRIAAQNPRLTGEEVESVVRAILDRIAAALADGDRVELREFGTFCVRDREPRIGRNPRTGERVMVKAKAAIHFKPAKTMRARLNREKIGAEQEAERFLRAS